MSDTSNPAERNEEEYLSEADRTAEWSRQEHRPSLIIDREYIVDALCERSDYAEMDWTVLSKIEEELSDIMLSRGVYHAINAAIADLANHLMGAPDIRTYKDWAEAGFVMVWSIYDTQSIHLNVEDWQLDFSVPEGVSDGVYPVRYRSAQGVGTSGNLPNSYAKIVDGKFVPYFTEKACLEAVMASYGRVPAMARSRGLSIDHIYIEGFRFDEDAGTLEVTVGS